MAISVRCRCGATYDVPDESSGLVFQCKTCDERLVASAQTQAAGVAPDPEMLRRVQESQEATDSRASNPGMLKISSLRYASAYPKWAVIWHGGLVLALVLTFLHSWWWALLAAFFVWAIRIYWIRAHGQFASGCVNPSVIISEKPPLVAVHTDLRMADNECPVIKILPQPIQRMLDGPGKQGQRVATVAFYEQGDERLDHWANFDPKLAAVVAADSVKLGQMRDSIEADGWDWLERGLKQLPTPHEPGLHRVYEEIEFRKNEDLDPAWIAECIHNYLGGHKYVELMAEGHMLSHEAWAYVPDTHRSTIIANIESAAASADKAQGLSLSPQGVFYGFKDGPTGAFAWADVVGAFATSTQLEITLSNRSRVRMSQAHFLNKMMVSLELLCNTIAAS